MHAVVSVVGKDRVGIISQVCSMLSEKQVNILDISQTILQGYFTMIMLVDAESCPVSLAELSKELKARGEAEGLEIHIQNEKIFEAMHRI